MIESSFSCSSLWDSDPFQDLSTDLPTDFDVYKPDLERSTSHLEKFSAFNDLSCSSSEHNNGLIFEGLEFLPVADSFISQILEESSSTDNWSWLEKESHNLPSENSLASTRKSAKKSKKRSRYLTSKAWSKMSPEEQIKTLHVLSELVTSQMGIREQIEVIKIIDPSVTISPDDKEFALDISSLNDSKMKRIRDYVQKVGYSLSNTNSSKKLNSSSKSCFTSKKPSHSRKLLSGKTNSGSKRRQKKQKGSADEDTLKKRKLELHGQKEVQSGLFVYEKVIKKLSNPLEEDEDVNILE